MLAALALHAIALQKSDGYLLRSRSQLMPIPDEPSKIEFIDETGRAIEIDPASLTSDRTLRLLTSAVENAKEAGLIWQAEPIRMEPSPKLLKLLALSQAGRGEEEDAAA